MAYELRLSSDASRALAEHLPLGVSAAIWEFLIGPLAGTRGGLASRRSLGTGWLSLGKPS